MRDTRGQRPILLIINKRICQRPEHWFANHMSIDIIERQAVVYSMRTQMSIFHHIFANILLIFNISNSFNQRDSILNFRALWCQVCNKYVCTLYSSYVWTCGKEMTSKLGRLQNKIHHIITLFIVQYCTVRTKSWKPILGIQAESLIFLDVGSRSPIYESWWFFLRTFSIRVRALVLHSFLWMLRIFIRSMYFEPNLKLIRTILLLWSN